MYWKHIPLKNSGWVSQFGTLTGLENIDPERQVELSPYVVSKVERFQADKANPFTNGKEWHNKVGLDGKVGITNDFTLDFTLNPDFGQVEADPSQVNLSAYETYFVEKRPFFVEGNNITNFNLSGGGNPFSMDNLFYSRRVGRSPQYHPYLDNGEYADVPDNTRILGAMKLTGKTRKGLSVGVIEALTAEETGQFGTKDSKHKEIVEPMTNYAVGRVQKDFSQGKTMLGGMFTSTHRRLNQDYLSEIPQKAYTGGLDFTHKWKDRKYSFTGKFTMSHVMGDPKAITKLQKAPLRYFNRPDASHVQLDTTRTSLTGHSGTLALNRNGSSKFRFSGFVTWRSPGLELNDAGYLRESDAIFQILWAGYRITEPFGIFRNLSINFNQWTGWNFDGNMNKKGANVSLSTQFKNYWSMAFGVTRGLSEFSTDMLRGGPGIKLPGGWNFWGRVGTDGRKKFRLSSFYSHYDADFQHRNYNSAGINLFYRPLNALEISLMFDYSVSNRNLQYISTEETETEDHYVFGGIKRVTTDITLRLDYAITPEMTLQYYGSPFIASGNYNAFKQIIAPRASDYKKRFAVYDADEIQLQGNDYQIDANGDGSADYSFSNPDFNFKQFRSNLVFRWEYSPGSLLYLVWSQSRTKHHDYGDFLLNRDFGNLFQAFPKNVFLVKLSYMLSL